MVFGTLTAYDQLGFRPIKFPGSDCPYTSSIGRRCIRSSGGLASGSAEIGERSSGTGSGKRIVKRGPGPRIQSGEAQGQGSLPGFDFTDIRVCLRDRGRTNCAESVGGGTARAGQTIRSHRRTQTDVLLYHPGNPDPFTILYFPSPMIRIFTFPLPDQQFRLLTPYSPDPYQFPSPPIRSLPSTRVASARAASASRSGSEPDSSRTRIWRG